MYRERERERERGREGGREKISDTSSKKRTEFFTGIQKCGPMSRGDHDSTTNQLNFARGSKSKIVGICLGSFWILH